MQITSLFSIACIVTILGCDRGLAPPPPEKTKPVLSGTVHFAGTMPPCDSVKSLAVVISQKAAPFAVSDIINEINKTIFVNVLASCSFQDTSYTFTLPPGDYRYLGVAQLFGDSLYRDWRIVGFSHTPEDSAQSFILNYGDVRTGVDLRIRFDSATRQPFIQ